MNDRYRGIYGGRRVILLNPDDIAKAGFKTGQLVDVYSHFNGQVRKAPQFAIVPYPIARRCAAAYYPETNVLVAVDSVAERSNQPVSKSIRITLHASALNVAEGVSAPITAVEKSLHRPDPAPRVRNTKSLRSLVDAHEDYFGTLPDRQKGTL